MIGARVMFFFFSSRRRHTRSDRDWSSDVCSSDLTFSKAWGLAGCRVGYALGSPYVIGVLRAAGGPYSVAAPSIALALAQLEHGEEALRAHVARIRVERAQLATRLGARRGGLAPRPSQANFVLVECGPRAQAIRQALADRGVVVRDFPGRPGLETSLRITF